MATACGGETPAAPATTMEAVTTVPSTAPALLDACPTRTIGLGDQTWLVAEAATRDLRIQGLRGVADLGFLDGMLFVFDAERLVSFTMRDTVMPIDIAFFDATGELVDRLGSHRSA